MKYFIKTLLIMLVSVNFNAYAVGGSSGGKIVHVASLSDVILFKIAGNVEQTRPECASTGRFAAHKDSAHASVVLMDFATGKSLANVRGLGSCNLWGNSEDVNWIEVCPASGC